MRGHQAIEAAKTVIEVADLAWTAMECRHHHHQNDAAAATTVVDAENLSSDDELESLKAENRRLRNLLEENLKLLRIISESDSDSPPCLLENCPPDLYDRLVASVDSDMFLNRLQSLQQASSDGSLNGFPFKEAKGVDFNNGEVMINISNEEPSWWVWITDDMVPSNVEERSGIDDESYVVVTEDDIVKGVANFMARCVLQNPKAQKMKPEELQKTLNEALASRGKLGMALEIWHAGMLFYTLSTWGLALAGLYKSRSVIKYAAKGVHKTTKLALRTL